MGTAIAPSRSKRLFYALLACAMVATLVQVFYVSPAQAVSGDTGPAVIPGTSTAGLDDPDQEWATKNQHRTWFVDGRWDGVLPMATAAGGGPAAGDSDWWIMKEVIPETPGDFSGPDVGVEVGTDQDDRPDVFFDGSTLYVLMSGADTTLHRFNYSGGDYTLDDTIVLPAEMNTCCARAAIFKDSNNDLWASVLNEDGLRVTRSTDDGDTWADPINLIVPVAAGQTQITEAGGDLAVAAAEDGGGELEKGRYSEFLFYTLDLANAANWDAVEMATGTLSLPNQPAATNTVTIGSETYTFVNTLGGENTVLIGANVAATQSNLVAAITADDGAGTVYGAGTNGHPDVVIGNFSGGGDATVTAKESGTSGNSIQISATGANVIAPTNLTGGTTTWAGEDIPLSQSVNHPNSVIHADDELSLVKDSSDNIYIAAETQRSGDITGIGDDPQIVLFKRTAANTWTQSNVKLDQGTTTLDYKRPVVAILDSTVHVIAVNHSRTASEYWESDLNLSGWTGPTPLFDTEFEMYGNNFVPRDPVTSSERLPVLVDWARPNTLPGDETTIWQTSLPNSDNQSPGVNAGVDRTVNGLGTHDLGGIITDDAVSGNVSWEWTMVSGPGAPTWGSRTGTCSGAVCELPTTVQWVGGTGTYVFRLSATEAGTHPLSNVDEVTIQVTNVANDPPTISVANPDDGDSYDAGEPVIFEASADDDGNDVSPDIVWTSSRDGVVAFGGGPFAVDTLSTGTHDIRARVSDGDNTVQSPVITITIGSTGGGGNGGGGNGGGGDGGGGNGGGGDGGGDGGDGDTPDFTDISGHTHQNAIIWLAQEGITQGCNPPTNDEFCPNDNVNRGQMAAFLARAFGYSDSGTENYFVDTVGNTFETAINRLRVAGVTQGCNPPDNDRYCPGGFVTRGQMAAFLVRAFGYSDSGTENYFTDTDGVFKTAIDRLRTAGVTQGCNPPDNDNYCPDDLVTRGQMATFLKRGFDNQ